MDKLKKTYVYSDFPTLDFFVGMSKNYYVVVYPIFNTLPKYKHACTKNNYQLLLGSIATIISYYIIIAQEFFLYTDSLYIN